MCRWAILLIGPKLFYYEYMRPICLRSIINYRCTSLVNPFLANF